MMLYFYLSFFPSVFRCGFSLVQKESWGKKKGGNKVEWIFCGELSTRLLQPLASRDFWLGVGSLKWWKAQSTLTCGFCYFATKNLSPRTPSKKRRKEIKMLFSRLFTTNWCLFSLWLLHPHFCDATVELRWTRKFAASIFRNRNDFKTFFATIDFCVAETGGRNDETKPQLASIWRKCLTKAP